ncbi:Ldh family oxidoreductase [Flavonifractor sp. An100]|uniref:Ldh family oxidoreductase n=1 Tax=Flavonifractor sp. An100 TaxID=1965538 RepID=UPI000B387D14|nr:Ldh family oxidoreductase [Flavonifractor sp. An100]OUQ78479.1 hypothetical protein B5E43_08325 [Flavonifractor sp. An100]
MKTISSKKIADFGVNFLCAYGASKGNAEIITCHLVDNDLKGVESQGAMRLFEYARFMVKGQIDGTAEPSIETVAPNAYVVDGNRGFGIVAMQKITDRMIQVLQEQPMSVAAVKGVGHTGRVGAYPSGLYYRIRGCWYCQLQPYENRVYRAGDGIHVLFCSLPVSVHPSGERKPYRDDCHSDIGCVCFLYDGGIFGKLSVRQNKSGGPSSVRLEQPVPVLCFLYYHIAPNQHYHERDWHCSADCSYPGAEKKVSDMLYLRSVKMNFRSKQQ